jgi:hypothetical protein
MGWPDLLVSAMAMVMMVMAADDNLYESDELSSLEP